MSQKKQKNSHRHKELRLRFNLFGLVFFSVSLIAATGWSVSVWKNSPNKVERPSASLKTVVSVQSASLTDAPPQVIPPWGELLTRDVRIDLPDEYVRLEEIENKINPWIFDGMKLQQVSDLMSACGLTTRQIEHALSPQLASTSGTSVIIQPDEDLTFSLSADARAKLYGELGKNPANPSMRTPIFFKNSFEKTISGIQLDEKTISMVKSLLYERGGMECLSDYGALMSRLPLNEQRRHLIEVFFNQSAVLGRLRIRPTTDIDKLLAYWRQPDDSSPGLRSLLEAIKRESPEGGTVNLINFLPQFARERLYTYPLPAQANAPVMDCHWSTLNFARNASNGHFAESKDIDGYVTANCYQVPKPTRYGDMIFLLDEKNQPVHSAVYIAGDIVFTKDGNDFRQPWTLGRMEDMIRTYSALGATRIVVWRKKTIS